jgi:hypothetical protein
MIIIPCIISLLLGIAIGMIGSLYALSVSRGAILTSRSKKP